MSQDASREVGEVLARGFEEMVVNLVGTVDPRDFPSLEDKVRWERKRDRV
jgi:hypothetical protein